jgi:CheY-like chemotaxis protein
MTRTVILVEDHEPVRTLYAEALRAQGWRVLERPSAQGLVALVMREAASLEAVVLDWTLPGDSGVMALRALKREPATRHVRVLMLTAHSSPALRARALAAGAEQFLQKPLRPQALLDALEQPLATAAHV